MKKTMKTVLVALAFLALHMPDASGAVVSTHATLTLAIEPADAGTVIYESGSWSPGETKTVVTSSPTGGEVLVNASAASGYVFAEWSVTPSGTLTIDHPTLAGAYIEIPSKDTGSYTVTATFKPALPPIEILAPYYVGGVAANGISDWVTNVVSKYEVVVSSASAVTWGAAGKESWYAVTNDVTIGGGVKCVGLVCLILCDGAKLTVSSTGIATDPDGSFTVYGEPGGAGELDASSLDDDAAGIGGGAFCSGRNITINGGTVTARGGNYGAGIGCGFGDDGQGGFGGVGSNIVINAGVVTAVGGQSSAGIGGSNESDGQHIVINGGIVTAVGGAEGAGIGGGQGACGKDIVINAGTVIVKMDGLYDELIGSGHDGAAASGVRIAPVAKVLFDLNEGVQGLTALPELGGRILLTPEVPNDHELVGGLDESGAAGVRALPFSLTNAVTGVTGTLAVDDASGTVFAGKLLKLSVTDGNLTLTVEEAPHPVPILAQTTPVDGTTLAVYTNGVLSSEVETGKWNAWSNQMATVVYTVTDPGRYFADGSTAVTNVFDTAKDPATAQAPVAPKEPSVKVGKPVQRYPWNGIVDVRYRVKNAPAGLKLAFTVTVGSVDCDAGTEMTATAGTVEGVHAIDFRTLGLEQSRRDAKVRATVSGD